MKVEEDIEGACAMLERQTRMVDAQYKNIKAFWMRDVGGAIISGEGIGADYDSGDSESATSAAAVTVIVESLGVGCTACTCRLMV